jgi:hypothetical protein
MIPLYLAVEDDLSEFVLRRVLPVQPAFAISAVFKKGGFGYLKKQTLWFNEASRHCPFLLLTDLDKGTCPPGLVRDWLKGRKRHPNFLLRVAVPEVESWLLADRRNLARFLGLRGALRIGDPEKLADPKACLLQIAEKASLRRIREAIVYRDSDGQRHQGPDYNGTLGLFVQQNWDFTAAADCCPSLSGLLRALDRFGVNYVTAGI